MNTFKTALTSLLAATLLCAPAFAAPGKVKFKGQARFVSDAPMEKINGIGPAMGAVNFDPEAPASVSGKIVVPLSSLETGNKKRDEHMRGGEWLEASKCPEISFEFSKAKLLDKSSKGDVKSFKLEVDGKFTVHCVTKPLKTTVTLKTKGPLVKVDSAFPVVLKDHEIKGKEGVMGSKVGNSVKASVSLKGKMGAK
jgi:polyisoprenoid-binding protein YceI